MKNSSSTISYFLTTSSWQRKVSLSLTFTPQKKMKQNILKVFCAFVVMVLFSFWSELQSAEWYKGQLHCHSVWSDGSALPELQVQWYKDHG